MNNWLHSAHVSKQQSRQEPKCSNTSTDVEKTRPESSSRRRAWKHLHGRGEDFEAARQSEPSGETPPRTWRRQLPGQQALAVARNTSTDVEKTNQNGPYETTYEKHLHGRGEDKFRRWLGCPVLETPPRPWRRLSARHDDLHILRNTSTDVEKTASCAWCRSCTWKHLHGRGEDFDFVDSRMRNEETPPRTWRRLVSMNYTASQLRNTSTDVEKTPAQPGRGIVVRKHLHGRGEDPTGSVISYAP